MKNWKERIETCTMCGNEYITTSNNAKYCPSCRVKKQRKVALQRYYARQKEKGTKVNGAKKKENAEKMLCWSCVNAVPNPNTGAGCSWSRDLIPVKGWKRQQKERGRSYVVRCPEFKRG